MAERDRLAAGDARIDAQRWLDDPPSGVAPLATKQPLKSSRPRPFWQDHRFVYPLFIPARF